MKKYFLFIVFNLILINLFPQSTDTLVQSNRSGALNVYFDCNSCDMTYFKQNFTIINYVRDRMVSDVHIIISEMENGGGGDEFTIQFLGQGRYSHLRDTLIMNTKADVTDDEERKALLTIIQKGLFPYIMKTPFASQATIEYTQDESEEEVNDPWNNWVFNFDISGYGNAEQSLKNFNIYSSVSAGRITERIKHYTRFNQSYSESKYRIFDDNDSLIYSLDVFSNSANFYHSTVWSLGQHWGGGIEGTLWHSTFMNTHFGWDLMPAIEYNVFKYKDASQKQLRLAYAAGYSFYNYIDTTIYNKMKEGLFYHKLTVQYKHITKWGSIYSSFYYKNFLKDLSLYNLGTTISTDIRLFKGLSLSLYGNFSLPRNQIALVKTTASTEEVLLQQHELKTQYSFYTSIGLSYTFGSIYNNVVNPRLD